jgi:hypothetical protein
LSAVLRTVTGFALVLLTTGLAGAAATPEPPQSVSASYDVFLHGAHIATMAETYEAKGGEYRLVSDSNAVGVVGLFRRETVRFVSSGKLTPAGLQPLRFEGKRNDSDPRRVRGEFDWAGGRLTIEHHGQTETLPLPRGTQDRLSFLYQFMFVAPDRPRQMEISMTNGRKLDRYQYTVEPGVELDTPLGRITTVHLVKQRQPDETATEIWLSPRHRYLPVKMMVVERNGSRYEQVATRLEIKP